MTEQGPKRVTEAFPPVTGEVGLVQGRYGEVGNLELVAPDPVSGFWIFWYNADRRDRREGAVVGAWSGGLHVETDSALLGTRIGQAASGPDYLEVVARSADGNERWTWRPGPGFLPEGPLSPATRSAPVVLEHAGALHAVLLLEDGAVEHAVSGTDAYPSAAWRRSRPFDLPDVTAADLTVSGTAGLVAVLLADGRPSVLALAGRRWEALPPPPGTWRTAALAAAGDRVLVVGRSASGDLLVAGRSPGDDAWAVDVVELAGGDPAVAVSTLDGGTLELVTRSGPTLTHARWSIDRRRLMGPDPGPLRSEVWAADGSVPIHRGPVRPR